MCTHNSDGMDRNCDVATVHFHGEYAPPFIHSYMRPRSTILIGWHGFFSKQASLGLACNKQKFVVVNLFRRLDAVHANGENTNE